MSQTGMNWDFILAHFPNQINHLQQLEKCIGYTFKNTALLYEACTHASSLVAYPWSQVAEDNKCHLEKLECLGDAVVDLIITDILWHTEKLTSEGELSRVRASLVNEASLATIAKKISLDRCIMMGNGEEKAGGRHRRALQADAFEAMIGAIYLDGGYNISFTVVQNLFQSKISTIVSNGDLSRLDPKTQLQEWMQAEKQITPVYEFIEASGPDHKRVFKVAVKFTDQTIAHGIGHTKKAASEQAALKALEKVLPKSDQQKSAKRI